MIVEGGGVSTLRPKANLHRSPRRTYNTSRRTHLASPAATATLPSTSTMSTAASSPLGLSLPHFAAHLQVQNGQVAAPAGRGRPRASQTGKAKGKTLYYCVALPRRTLEQEKVESSRVQELVRYIPNKEDPNIMEVLRLRLWATETVLRTIESTMGVRFM